MSRLDDMLARYGEVTTRVQAAKILGCSVGKVKSMLTDGRLETACAGTMVDVRSIVTYIEKPEPDRVERLKRDGRAWAV